MTVLSGQTIRLLGLIEPCLDPFKDANGNSGGLGPAGYDLTLDQDVDLWPGEFKLASTAELFKLPPNIIGIIHDKSSLARLGLAVQNTVAEPGWTGFLTLEITNHSNMSICLNKGSAICQVIFHFLDTPTLRPYEGKYQNQERGPQEARGG